MEGNEMNPETHSYVFSFSPDPRAHSFVTTMWISWYVGKFKILADGQDSRTMTVL